MCTTFKEKEHKKTNYLPLLEQRHRVLYNSLEFSKHNLSHISDHTGSVRYIKQ